MVTSADYSSPGSVDHIGRAHDKRGLGFWALMVLAIVLVLFGLPILGGGAYLAYLGGSWYYFFAGLGLILTAVLLFQRSPYAVPLYALTYLGTLIWAFWEAGLDWWAQVPRLVAPTVILVLVLLTIPLLSIRTRPVRRQ